MKRSYQSRTSATKAKRLSSVRSLGYELGLLLCVAVVLVATYTLGDHHGAARQKSYDQKHPVNTSKTIPVAPQNRWSAIGMVVEISATTLKIRDTKNQTIEASITKDTVFVDNHGKPVLADTLKKGGKVVASGSVVGQAKTASRLVVEH